VEIKEALEKVKNKQMTIDEAVEVINNYTVKEKEPINRGNARKIKVYVEEGNGKRVRIPGVPLWAISPMVKFGLWMGKKQVSKELSQEEITERTERIHRKINEAIEEIDKSDLSDDLKEEKLEKLNKKRKRKIEELTKPNYEAKKGIEKAQEIDFKALVKELKKCGPITLVEVDGDDGERVLIRTI